MPYEPQPTYLRALLLSANKQTTFGTALLDAAMTYRSRFDGGGMWVRTAKEYYSDADRAGKGHPYATVRQNIAIDTSFSGQFDLDDFLAGWLLAFLLHKVVSAGPGPYTHTFTFDPTTTRIAPVTTIYTEDLAAQQIKYSDVVLTSLTISGSDKGPLQVSFEAVGSGKRSTDPVTLVALPTPVYLLGNDTDILLGAPAAAASIKERVRGWSVTFTNGVTMHRATGGGLYPTFAKIGLPRVSVQLSVAAKDTEDIETLFINDTLQELQINTNSGAAAQLNLKVLNLRFLAEPAAEGLEKIWNLSADGGRDVTKGAGNYVEAVAINSQATFLVAA